MLPPLIVSIPFKREGISELKEISHEQHDYLRTFQFPSNGKVFPNGRGIKIFQNAKRNVFQFPSNGKVFPNRRFKRESYDTIEVSIPFKREGISERYGCNNHHHRPYFQVSIPFKRESISERAWRVRCEPEWGRVSIPFKRESISEPSKT